MEIKLENYNLLEGEILTATATPEAEIIKLTDKTWSLQPEIDGVYKVTIESNIQGLIHQQYSHSMTELLLRLNNMTVGVARTEKEELLEADIRAITACIAIENYTEAQAQIEVARETWII